MHATFTLVTSEVYYIFLLLFRCLVVLVWLCVGVCGTSNQNDCFDLFETYDQGVYVCHEHPDLIPALHIAESMGRVQCQRAFEGERWNCSGFSILKSPNITSRGWYML